MSASHKFVPLAPADPDLSSVLKGSLFQQHTSHAMPALWTLQKVRKLRKLIITLFFIGLLAFPTSALPLEQPHTTIKENGNKITVKVKGCKPLSSSELVERLGPSFDEATMAYDEASAKRSMALQSALEEEEEEDVNNEEELEEEMRDETQLDENSDKDKKTNKDAISVRDAYFMRRRRAVELDSDVMTSEEDRQFLYHNLLHDTVRSRSRKRRSYKKTAKVTPWHCKLRKTWRVLDNGYFPKRILDGSCTQKTCFYGMYTCNPIRFTVKVLKKDPEDACRPIPLIGQNTTYEESWVFRREHVVVACECQYASRSSKRKRTKVRLKS